MKEGAVLRFDGLGGGGRLIGEADRPLGVELEDAKVDELGHMVAFKSRPTRIYSAMASPPTRVRVEA
jgi:hypothetical protein